MAFSHSLRARKCLPSSANRREIMTCLFNTDKTTNGQRLTEFFQEGTPDLVKYLLRTVLRFLFTQYFPVSRTQTFTLRKTVDILKPTREKIQNQ